MKSRFSGNKSEKRAGVSLLISDKMDFMSETVRDKGHYIMIKGSNHEEDITVVNIYACNNGAPKYTPFSKMLSTSSWSVHQR